jgi:hypothetical protein
LAGRGIGVGGIESGDSIPTVGLAFVRLGMALGRTDPGVGRDMVSGKSISALVDTCVDDRWRLVPVKNKRWGKQILMFGTKVLISLHPRTSQHYSKESITTLNSNIEVNGCVRSTSHIHQ